MFERFNRRSATLTATALIATMGLGGAAIAASGSAKHPAKAVVAQSQTSSETTSGPDTDNVNDQVGDQNTPDAASAAAEKTGTESATSETATASDGPGGHADEPGNPNANNQAQGEG